MQCLKPLFHGVLAAAGTALWASVVAAESPILWLAGCENPLQPTVPATLTVRCTFPTGGVASAVDFRIAGAESHPQWIVSLQSAVAGSTVTGDPFEEGVHIDLGTCVDSHYDMTLLVIRVIPLAPVPDGYWRFSGPASSGDGCATVVQCAPDPATVNARSSYFHVNSCILPDPSPAVPACTVGVAPSSWSRVKYLFR